MSKHTLGEWYAQQTLIPVGDEVSWAVLCEENLNAGYVVAMCYGPDAEANAKMIALVPYLLDAVALAHLTSQDANDNYGRE